MSLGFLTRRLRNLSWLAPASEGTQSLGRRGEEAAAKHLKRRSYRILARNYNCPLGEIDLVCRDGDTIVFVEVKTRSSILPQDPGDWVRRPQWARIGRAARFFLRQRAAEHHPWRFDLVMVDWPSRGRPHVEHFEDAYQPRRS